MEATFESTVRIVEIIILVGLVIFVHELGHFLVARWCGVLVERFSIGFGPVILSFKRGDTEYAVSAIPLGGYVKMLGQTDTPEVEEESEDKRSYQNKNVLQRMAIISAGVIMNVIFGFICFVAAYHMGVKYSPAIIGTVVPGQPAWTAGIQPGDHIVAINGKERTDYEMLVSDVATCPVGQSVLFTIERDGKLVDFPVMPVLGDMKPQVGVLLSNSLTLYKETPTHAFSPAARTEPAFEGEDAVVAVDGEPVGDYRALSSILFAKQDKPLTLTVERKQSGQDAPALVQIKIEPNYIRTLGLEMDPGEIIAVQNGSPAALATDAENKPSPIMPKDVVKAVDGVEQIDPLRLPDLLAAKAGKRVQLTLLRPGKEEKHVTVYVTPRAMPSWIDFQEGAIPVDRVGDHPMSAPAIGIAYKVQPTVRRVVEKSPAASAATPILPGDVIKAIVYTIDPEGKGELIDKTLTIDENMWAFAFWGMQSPEVRRVKLKVERSGQAFEVPLEPTPDKSWSFWQRGLLFRPVMDERIETTVVGAISAGLEKTKVSITRLYLFLRGLFTRTISTKFLAGPITIARVAYDLSVDFPLLIFFLGQLSINLAVINFLPIPILDGGHIVFLTYELIMRRKAGEKAVLIANYVGLAVILVGMIYVLGLDITRLTGQN